MMCIHFGENYLKFYDGKSAHVVAVTPREEYKIFIKKI
jgi:hypothetical protein